MLSVTDPESVLHLVDKYGVSLSLVVAFAFATVYILRRLLAEKNGILTQHFKSDAASREHLVDSVRTMATTGERIGQVLEGVNTRLESIEGIADRLERIHYDPHSRFATMALGRCALDACDVAEKVVKQMDQQETPGGLISQVLPLLEGMRGQLKEHLLLAEHQSMENPT